MGCLHKTIESICQKTLFMIFANSWFFFVHFQVYKIIVGTFYVADDRCLIILVFKPVQICYEHFIACTMLDILNDGIFPHEFAST